jgi:methyltransferase (TIGR00027 family)
MARTDDDSWDITEGVGATALGVAWSRSEESASSPRLFTDPYAKLFIEAAQERGWRPPGEVFRERIRRISGYVASRTKWFDEFLVAAGANGIEQVVILAAGLDSRAWRLPWIAGTTVYEIDQPKVLAFKAETLRDNGVQAAARYVPIPVDLRQDWPSALKEAGFDVSTPTAWTAEGLLPYLPADGQDALFERIHSLSARGSRVAVEAFGSGFFNADYLASRAEQLRRLREETGATDDEDAFDVQHQWYVEERSDVADWLRANCWEVTAVDSDDLMTRYGRRNEDADATPRTVFVEGHLAA